MIGILRALESDAAQNLSSFASFAGVPSFTLAAFGIVTGILLIRKSRNAVIVAKIYTAAIPALAVLALIVILANNWPTDVRNDMVQEGVTDVIKALGFFAIWFTYLCRSRRVKSTYPPTI